MAADEPRLVCRVCSGEVGLVRINADLLTLGHKRQPKDRHHYVRLARPRLASPLGVVDGAATEGPNTRREDSIADLGPSFEAGFETAGFGVHRRTPDRDAARGGTVAGSRTTPSRPI